MTYRSVLDKGLRIGFEEDEVDDEDDFWTGPGGCRVDDDRGVGFTVDLVEAIERLIAAIAALLLADTSFARSCALVFALEVVLVSGFDWTCFVVVALHVWSDGNRCLGQNCWLHSFTSDQSARSQGGDHWMQLTLQRIGANNCFLHFGLAQCGWTDFLVFPVITEHSFTM